LPDGGGKLRVIAGGYGSAQGLARTFTPINIWDVRFNRGKTVSLDVPEGHTLSVLIGQLGSEGLVGRAPEILQRSEQEILAARHRRSTGSQLRQICVRGRREGFRLGGGIVSLRQRTDRRQDAGCEVAPVGVGRKCSRRLIERQSQQAMAATPHERSREPIRHCRRRWRVDGRRRCGRGEQ
jgi:hypothetical protein